ncbi:restriction endonuclease subunit S [Liberiplasma polymorphum]|uniref:restriction endonuclease subunit S n=1 Tax=Liberiplasma polymorphum TaxID=3374570 RepID=UPI00377462B4
MEYLKFSKFIKNVQYGYTADSTSIVEGDAKYLRITDIVPYFVDKNRVPYCQITKNKKSKYLVKENDLLIARTGATTGYNLLVPKDYDNFIFASYLVRVNYDKKQIYPKYLKYILKSQQWYGFIKNFIGGSAQPGMNPKTFGKFEFPFTGYDNQMKIAQLLEKYDNLIELNIYRVQILEQIAENQYKDWFVKFRVPGYKNYKFVIQNPRGWMLSTCESKMRIPIGWKYDELISIAEFKRGKNVTAAEMFEGEIPVISAGLNPSGYHNEANVFGKNITVSSSGANAGYLSYHLGDIWAADCSYYQNDSNLWFVYNALKFLQPVISNMQVGSAQPHVYAKTINKLSTIIPPNELIELYCEKVNPIYEQIRLLTLANENLVKQRDALLPRLMSGKLNLEGKEIV